MGKYKGPLQHLMELIHLEIQMLMYVTEAVLLNEVKHLTSEDSRLLPIC